MRPPPDAIARRAASKRRGASIKRIMGEIVEDDEALIRQSLRDGLLAPPPRSFPYLALAASYLDGRPTAQQQSLMDLTSPSATELEDMTTEELATRAEQIALGIRALLHEPKARAAASTVIDVEPEPRHTDVSQQTEGNWSDPLSAQPGGLRSDVD